MKNSVHIPVWEGQRVERTNARGRNVYCQPFKAWMVEQALKPDMSTAGLAMRNQVNANQLRRWVLLRCAHAGAELLPRLLPVSVVHEAEQEVVKRQPTTCVEIELAGAVVRVNDGVNAGTLRLVLDVLRDTNR